MPLPLPLPLPSPSGAGVMTDEGVRVGVVAPGGCEGLEGHGLTCPVCGKAFCSRNRRQDLQRHLLSHTGEKPFPCPFCPYRASLKGNLKKHMHVLHAQLLMSVDKNMTSQAASTLTSSSTQPSLGLDGSNYYN